MNYRNSFVIKVQRVLFHALTMRVVGQLYLQITRNLMEDKTVAKVHACRVLQIVASCD